MEILAFAQNYLLTFIVMLSVLVFVHEFGHFWVARLCGVKIETFSIGFGREIFGFTDKHGTRWKFSWLPLGGFVKMYGDADAASAGVSAEAEAMSAEERKHAFFAKNVGQRAAIVAAGPAFNYLFAIIVLSVLFMTVGRPYTAPEVGAMQPDGAAAQAGLQVGDRILAVGGTPVERFEDVQNLIMINTGAPVDLTIKRGEAEQTIAVTPKLIEMTDNFGNHHTTARLGISKSGTEFRKYAPLQSIGVALGETYRVTVNSLKSLGQVIMGTRSSDELGGPLRIAKMTGDMAEMGFIQVIWFSALLSISLGLINLFPVPVLDGGHLVFYFFEAIRGRPLSTRVQDYGFRVGFGAIVALMLFATWNDLVSLQVFTHIKNLLS